MKILSTVQIREADSYTIKNEPVASADLMERAAHKCYKWLLPVIPQDQKIYIFCGTGNNGGDGLVIARLLQKHRNNIVTIIVRASDKCSDDFSINLKLLKKNPKNIIREVTSNSEFPQIENNSVIIDAILGSGLSKPVTGLIAELIGHINNSDACKVFSIDIPSGLFGEDNTENNGCIIKAHYTLTFQFPKLAFFFAENYKWVGEWFVLPIGLHQDYISKAEAKNYLLTKESVIPLISSRAKFSHKGNYGHALLIAGSYGKAGAAVLASRAILKSGAGLCTVHTPRKCVDIIQIAAPEVMVSVDEDKYCISQLPDISGYNAVGIGPGIVTDDKTRKVLKLLIQECGSPVLLDADAINILGENKTWLSFLVPDSILTPHPKEFDRIAGKSNCGYSRWQKQVELSVKHQIYIVLKGAHTSISCPDGTTYFNTTGNPGMATAGSGDVLTGIITALLAKGHSSREACLIGTYLHGLAGDIAAKYKTQEAMTSGDIVEYLNKAWKCLK